MIVLDASAAIDWLLQSPAGQRIERRIYSRNETLHAPHLFDVEVAQVLRRMAREKTISAERADLAMQDLQNLRIFRYPHSIFPSRIWQLRQNLTAYDAAYVALAEQLDVPLITRDARLAAAATSAARIELF